MGSDYWKVVAFNPEKVKVEDDENGLTKPRYKIYGNNYKATKVMGQISKVSRVENFSFKHNC